MQTYQCLSLKELNKIYTNYNMNGATGTSILKQVVEGNTRIIKTYVDFKGLKCPFYRDGSYR